MVNVALVAVESKPKSSPDFAAKAELYRGQSRDDKLVQDGAAGPSCGMSWASPNGLADCTRYGNTMPLTTGWQSKNYAGHPNFPRD